MALTLTEALIRNRVNLTHENLEDIKSLSLPGTYHEKIVTIGTSLRRFTRLKSLDFSRNALESLQGLEHLQLLEKLNLYYNNVSSLEELKLLKFNLNLKEVDLRLNPVTRNEPDYRLYLIHILPNLQKLDDRGVRDRERQAALNHFGENQASAMIQMPQQSDKSTKAHLPRTEMMSKLMKYPSALPADDVAVIDMVNHQNGDICRHRSLSGSVAREDKVEDYTLDDLKHLDQPNSTRHRGKTLESVFAMADSLKKESPSPAKDEDPCLNRYKDLYPNIMSMPGENFHKIGEAYKSDPNLLFHDEVEAASRYRGQGYFTPHPQGETDRSKFDRGRYQDPLSVSDPVPKTERNEHYGIGSKKRMSRQDMGARISQDDMAWTRPRLNRTNSVPAREVANSHQEDDAKERTLIYSLLNLVDRYWNGSKSLHKHSKFIEQALKYLFEYTLTREHIKEEETFRLRRKVASLEEEIASIKKTANNCAGETSEAKEAELRAALRKSHEDIKRMHAEIRHYINENRILHKKLDHHHNFSSNCETSAPENAKNTAPVHSETADSQPASVVDLQYQNNVLSQELDLMKAKLKQYGQLQELASMLQESHKSLVETNDHLLQELQDSKDKHQQEIEQMHWSYKQLKSTLSYSTALKSSPLSQNNSNLDPSQLSSLLVTSRDRQEKDRSAVL